MGGAQRLLHGEHHLSRLRDEETVGRTMCLPDLTQQLQEECDGRFWGSHSMSLIFDLSD